MEVITGRMPVQTWKELEQGRSLIMLDVITPDELKDQIKSDELCKQYGSAIYKSNPHRRWLVEVYAGGRMASVKIPEISMDYGVFVDLDGSITTDTKKMITAASELLERFALTREQSDNHDLMSLARNSKGVIGADKGEKQH